MSKMGKTLCIYALHEYNLNLEYFIKHALVDDPEVDFYFVVNNPTLKLTVPKGKVVNRENKNFDFGGWSQVLLTDDLYKQYDYFILVNSTVRGPFYPLWYEERNWIKLFTSKITPDLKLFGIMIGNETAKPHVQSMFLVTDKVGMDIGITGGIFKLDEPSVSAKEIINKKEIGYSTLIMEKGYNIGCMLKALQGRDFRINKGPIYHMFEENYYYGTNIHPYETIFCKMSTKVLRAGRNRRLVDLYTNWEEDPPENQGPLIDPTQYLLMNPDLPANGLITTKAAENHYRCYGYRESRSHRPDQPLYYRVDLKADGFINNLYSLVNSILLSHYTGRYLVVTGFYSQYKLSEVIDLARLNLLLAELNLSTYLFDINMIDPYLRGTIDNCQRSRYFNPAQGDLRTLINLKSESGRILNLGTPSPKDLFMENPDLAISLLVGIKFVHPLIELVRSLDLGKYKVVHLGSETLNYKEALNRFARPEERLFIPTDLDIPDELRRDHPNITTSNFWREKIGNFSRGREIIDYLICTNGISFLGDASEFSKALLYTYKSKNKLVYRIEDPLDSISWQERPFEVISSYVSHGKLGLCGELGFCENGVSSLPKTSLEMISAHAPSVVMINATQNLKIRGSCSPTSRKPPGMLFFCDGKFVGRITAINEETPILEISPGIHELKILSSDPSWAHSIWLID